MCKLLGGLISKVDSVGVMSWVGASAAQIEMIVSFGVAVFGDSIDVLMYVLMQSWVSEGTG